MMQREMFDQREKKRLLACHDSVRRRLLYMMAALQGQSQSRKVW